MSREIASAIVEDRLKELRKFSYGALVKLVGQVSCDQLNGTDGGSIRSKPRHAGTARQAAMFA
jgi:hypothetical protein